MAPRVQTVLGVRAVPRAEGSPPTMLHPTITIQVPHHGTFTARRDFVLSLMAMMDRHAMVTKLQDVYEDCPHGGRASHWNGIPRYELAVILCDTVYTQEHYAIGSDGALARR